MNRADMREILKYCLHEPAGAETDQFSISELNTLLNRAILWVEMKVIRINPDAVLAVDTFGLVANKNLYPVPVGSIAIRKIVRTIDGKRLGRRADGYMDVTYGAGVGENLSNVTTGTSPDEWCPFGRFMRFGPTPNNTLANAIAVTYIPSLTIADDTTVPQLAEGLFDAVVNRAWCLGLRPNADIAMKAAAAKALEESLEDFDNLAGVPTDGAIQFMPDFDPIDGLYGSSSIDSETRQ